MTTTTWQDLAHPQKSAGQMAEEVNWVEITEGTEKQIKFANDLRNAWLSEITDRNYVAKVRWASLREPTEDLDFSRLAIDAWNRRAITKGLLNTSSTKDIINFFKDIKMQSLRSDMIGNYEHIIRFPKKWKFNGKKWERISYK